jgi:hypothetical protein
MSMTIGDLLVPVTVPLQEIEIGIPAAVAAFP